jgi:hypothetical protein
MNMLKLFAVAGALAMSCAAIPLAAQASQAQPTLPDAAYSLGFQNSNQVPSGPGVYTETNSLLGDFGSRTFTLGLKPSPSLALELVNRGGAVGTLSYYFEIIGPGGELVPLTLAGTLSASLTGVPTLLHGGSNILGEVQLYPGSDNTGPLATEAVELASTRDNRSDQSVSRNFVIPLQAIVGQLYRIDLSANGDISAGATQVEAYHAHAFVDPVITIDPNFVDGSLYSLSESAGAGNAFAPTSAVPEPLSWALMLIGFGGLGACLRRQRRILAEVS